MSRAYLGKRSVNLTDCCFNPHTWWVMTLISPVTFLLVCFLSCPPLQSGLHWCLLPCKALFQAAYPRSADINGKTRPEFSRSTADRVCVMVVSSPVERICHLALRLPLMVFAISFSALVVFHPPLWDRYLVVSLAHASTCEADPLPAAISRRREVVVLFRQDSRDSFLFELLQGHCLESSE